MKMYHFIRTIIWYKNRTTNFTRNDSIRTFVFEHVLLNVILFSKGLVTIDTFEGRQCRVMASGPFVRLRRFPLNEIRAFGDMGEEFLVTWGRLKTPRARPDRRTGLYGMRQEYVFRQPFPAVHVNRTDGTLQMRTRLPVEMTLLNVRLQPSRPRRAVIAVFTHKGHTKMCTFHVFVMNFEGWRGKVTCAAIKRTRQVSQLSFVNVSYGTVVHLRVMFSYFRQRSKGRVAESAAEKRVN